MLINLSNHPLISWSDKQLETANMKYGNVIDIPFPPIEPTYGNSDINIITENYLNEILKLISNSEDVNNAVHLMGEFTFVFKLATRLINKNILVLASTSKRNTIDTPNGKLVKFEFVQFREYSF